MRYTREYTARTYELDRWNALPPTPLVQYMQETAERQIHDQDMDYLDLYYKERKAYIISRMNIEVYRTISRFAPLRAETWITEGRAANFPRAYELYCGEDLVARAFSNWALVDVDTKKLVLARDYDTSAYPKGEAPEMHIPNRFRIPADLELKPVEIFTVRRSQTDVNGHMNNAKYFNCLYDRIPDMEEQFITSMNIRFVHEAPKGCDVQILMSDYQEPGKMDPNAERIIYFKTLVEGETNIEAVFGLKSMK